MVLLNLMQEGNLKIFTTHVELYKYFIITLRTQASMHDICIVMYE